MDNTYTKCLFIAGMFLLGMMISFVFPFLISAPKNQIGYSFQITGRIIPDPINKITPAPFDWLIRFSPFITALALLMPKVFNLINWLLWKRKYWKSRTPTVLD